MAQWNTADHRGVHVFQFQSPHLAGVGPEEKVGQGRTDTAEKILCRILRVLDRLGDRLQKCGYRFGVGKRHVVEHFQRAAVDRERHETPIVQLSRHAVAVGHHRAKAGDPVENLLVLRVKQVRTIGVDAHAVGIDRIMRVTRDVIAPVDDLDPPAGFGKGTAIDSAGKARPHDQDRAGPVNGRRLVQLRSFRSLSSALRSISGWLSEF